MTASKNYAEQNGYDLLSKFQTLDEFNHHFEQAMALHKDKFTKSEYLALNKLRKFAADFFGVAWCKAQKAVAATHQDMMFGVSRRTFDRMLVKVKMLNLVTVIHQSRENNWQKHNVYVFNRVEELTPEKFEIVSKSNTIGVPVQEKIVAPITKNLSLTNKTKDKINTYTTCAAANKMDKSIVKKEKPSLRKRMAAVLHQKRMTHMLDELAAIGYNMIRKLCAAEPRISKEAAEDVAFIEFTSAVNSKSAKNVFAVFSSRMRNVISLLSGQETQMNSTEIALRQGKKVGVIPQWFIDKEKNPIKKAQLQAAKDAYDNYFKNHPDPKLPNQSIPVYNQEAKQLQQEKSGDDADMQREMAALGVKTEAEYFEHKRKEFLARIAGA